MNEDNKTLFAVKLSLQTAMASLYSALATARNVVHPEVRQRMLHDLADLHNDCQSLSGFIDSRMAE